MHIRGGSSFLRKGGGVHFSENRGQIVFSKSVELGILHKTPVNGLTNKWTHLFLIWIKRTEHVNPHIHCWRLVLFSVNRLNAIVVNVMRASGTNCFVLRPLGCMGCVGMCACVWVCHQTMTSVFLTWQSHSCNCLNLFVVLKCEGERN
jgi:hypothetical protein